MGDPEKGTDAQHHSPIFKTNDEVLVDGVMLLSALAWMWLEQA
jgi:amidohydrolase